jgi:hypothetical protein
MTLTSMLQSSSIAVLRQIPIIAAFAGTLFCTSTGLLAQKNKERPVEPDYTKGEAMDPKTAARSIWALGSTGASGTIWAGGNIRAGEATKDTRMIQIRRVFPGTPADGVLLDYDVVLGVVSPSLDGKQNPGGRFDRDARMALSDAITAAEKKENGGKLELLIWRPETDTKPIVYTGKAAKTAKEKGLPTIERILKEPVVGKEMVVTLKLPVMGTFSQTSPWECDKTTSIINAAAQSVDTSGWSKGGGIPECLAGLGLLATGEEKYLPAVKELAHALAKQSERLDIHSDNAHIGSWAGGYRNVFLTEYYLATKDAAVLPGITALSRYMSLGQSGVGTWSHGMSYVKMNGLYGPPSAYGAMNQCTTTIGISLILAQNCGIDLPEVNQAVVRTLGFLRWFVDKGAIPYGDHTPVIFHDANGKNSQAAVLFDFAGDKEAADYFTRMTVASYKEREFGHTGNYFSWMWGALGAARGGDKAAQSFIGKTRWFTELERRADGSSIYQFMLHRQEHHKHAGWNTTGERLLHHCLPRKKLHITGKGGSSISPITGADLEEVVAAANFNPAKLTAPELLKALGNWSIVVREKAAMELGNREEDVVDQLIAMLVDSPNRHARYGACIGLQYAGRKSTKAVQVMVDMLQKEKNTTMRYFIIRGLQLKNTQNGLGDAVLAAGPALLQIAADFDLKQDPNGKLQAEIASTLFYAGRAGSHSGYFPDGNGIEKQNPDLVVAAMKAWLKNPNGGARSLVSSAYDDLPPEQLNQIWPEVYYAAKHQAPSGVMFSGKGQAASVILLSKNRFEEGLPIALNYLTRQGWGKFGRVPAGLEALSYYGSAAKKHMPLIQPEYDHWKDRQTTQDAWKIFQENIDKTVELRSIKPYVKEEDLK